MFSTGLYFENIGFEVGINSGHNKSKTENIGSLADPSLDSGGQNIAFENTVVL